MLVETPAPDVTTGSASASAGPAELQTASDEEPAGESAEGSAGEGDDGSVGASGDDP
jgi:hypothetical protein